VFKPAGIPLPDLDQVVMKLDEFEAIRLADLAQMYQEKAAKQMGISRPTFSRIIDSAHRKLADALVHGKALLIDGGAVRRAGRRCCELHDGDDEPAAAAPRSAPTKRKGRKKP
jgi:hypothetical protein